MNDDKKFDFDFDIDAKQYNNFMSKFRKKYKYLLYGIKVLGILVGIAWLLNGSLFVAFLIFVMFFPEEITIIKWIIRLIKCLHAFKDKHGHHDNT